MSRTYQTTNIVAEGNYLNEAGTFHCVVNRVLDGVDQKGNPLSGFNVQFTVLAGTVEGAASKEFNLTFFDPDMSRSEGSQRWATKKQTAFFVATNLMNLQAMGEEVEIDVAFSEGSQVVIQVEKDDDGKYLQLCWANIYHVDDPRAKEFPKDQQSLSILDAGNRKKPEYFESLTSKKTGQPQSTPRVSAEDLDSL